jgi:hypothetical protein
MNELAMDLSAAAVNDRYFEVLIIPQAAIAEVLCKLFTVLDSLQVILKIDADPVSHRDAILWLNEGMINGENKALDAMYAYLAFYHAERIAVSIESNRSKMNLVRGGMWIGLAATVNFAIGFIWLARA